MAIELRAARAADAGFVADVLLWASRGHLARGPWDHALPGARERDPALAFLAGGSVPSWCHHTAFQVAEVDGVVAAALCCFEPGADFDASLAQPVAAALGAIGAPPDKLATIAPVFGAYLSGFPEFAPGHWIVENVGTHPDFRRRGLLARLLDRALERGRARGLAAAQISCLIGNDAAQRAYEKAGFRAVDEKKDPKFEALLGVPGFSRMTVAL